ncbi:hypothetical protein DVH24_016248 [Malus domestica]|uniref:Uncharacterized protein n=1 Tax=Malus domestica TaxID=3750 RepID=A0A498HPP5_MALDO|nr:hypothetical protein DVH24_016248 [Malus domestica]
MLLKLIEFLDLTQTLSAGLIDYAGYILLCLFLLHGRQTRGLFLNWAREFLSNSHCLAEVLQGMMNIKLRWEYILGDEERLRKSALLWRVKVDIYRNFFITGRGTILLLLSATKSLTKLPIISAKLRLHVTGVDKSRSARGF